MKTLRAKKWAPCQHFSSLDNFDLLSSTGTESKQSEHLQQTKMNLGLRFLHATSWELMSTDSLIRLQCQQRKHRAAQSQSANHAGCRWRQGSHAQKQHPDDFAEPECIRDVSVCFWCAYIPFGSSLKWWETCYCYKHFYSACSLSCKQFKSSTHDFPQTWSKWQLLQVLTELAFLSFLSHVSISDQKAEGAMLAQKHWAFLDILSMPESLIISFTSFALLREKKMWRRTLIGEQLKSFHVHSRHSQTTWSKFVKFVAVWRGPLCWFDARAEGAAGHVSRNLLLK